MFVSGSAFFAGYAQNSYTTAAADLREEANALKVRLDRMETMAVFLMEQNIDLVHDSVEKSAEIGLKDREFYDLNDTLTDNQRQAYISAIVSMLEINQGHQDMQIEVVLFYHFNQTTTPYYIAREEYDGYDFNITYAMWQEYVTANGSPVVIWNATQYYGHLFAYNYIKDLPEPIRPKDPITSREIFVFGDAGISGFVDYFLMYQVRTLQNEVNSRMSSADSHETQADRVALAVSLTTVGVVISTAILNSIYQRKLEDQYELLKKKEGEAPPEPHDYLTLPLIMVALAIAIVGIVVPLLR